ncbi:MAG: hypothetical protein A2309_04945 [Bacteroidetes bacterium RIFOXYB2_FULL_35_7]|nr:MAG: hypothetical protein A2309_04945 [Bacteroidetes bacterium RIFOXYB2_FULL_35_7]HBX53514.1 hypothetical protein [Bacteroidales bacterium]
MPLFIRHFLQERYNSKITHLPDFIWDELVKIVKQESDWENNIASLYPNQTTSAIVLTHDVETQIGFDYIPKVIELEQKYGFKASWNLVPYKYKITDDILKIIRNAGHEIGIHGYNHDGKLYFSKEIFDYRVKYINEAIEKYGAVGFRSPMVHRNLEWLQQLNIQYDASCFDYDPYQPFPGGTGCIWPFKAGKLIELPYTLPQDHVLFYVLKQKNIDIWKNKTNWLIQNHGMILALIHPDYLLEKNHLKLYEEFLAFLKEIPNTWHCLPKEITEYFA